MLDRFTETAKHIVSDARELASSMNHTDISNEHLLSSILNHENSLACQMIIKNHVPGEIIDRQLRLVFPESGSATDKGIGFDEYVKKTIEKAFRHTEALKYTWISSAIIMLGILESGSRLSEGILTGWGLNSNYLLKKIKQSGDLSESVEEVRIVTPLDEEIMSLSRGFSEDLKKVIGHAVELSRSYKSPEIGLHLLVLSFVFLVAREVITVPQINKSRFDLEAVKKLVAMRLADLEQSEDPRMVFAPDVCRVCRTAVYEARFLGAEEVDTVHLSMALLALFPELSKNCFKIDYSQLRRKLLRNFEPAQNQITIQTRPVDKKPTVFPKISLRRYNADPGAVIMIPKKLAEDWGVMALHINENTLTIAMIDPGNAEIVEKIRELVGMDIAIIKTDEKDLQAAFKMFY